MPATGVLSAYAEKLAAKGRQNPLIVELGRSIAALSVKSFMQGL